MYLRTTKRKNADGSIVEYFQLAHNIRDTNTGQAKAQIIHNFGRSDQLDKKALERLAQSICRTISSEVVSTTTLPDSKKLQPNFDVCETYEYGLIYVIEDIWEKLQIGKAFLKACHENENANLYERALFAMVANRLCDPESKLGIWERWLKKTYLPSAQNIKLAQMYVAMDLFLRHQKILDYSVFRQTANLLNLAVDLIFYDTTTASFSVDEEDEDLGGSTSLRKRGHSKSGGWPVQVVVGLAVTREGFPVKSWVFPGNTADVSTVKKIRDDLREWQLGQALFIGDAGMNSEDNREHLARDFGKYILAARLASVEEIRDEVLKRAGRFSKVEDNLFVKEVKIGSGVRERRYILCFNPNEAKRQKIRREEVVKALEELLAGHKEKSATAKWAIELLASKRNKRYLKIVDGKISIDREAVKKYQKYDGKWVLQTNDTSISAIDGASAYKSMMLIERCFRSMKSGQIWLCPLYHRMEDRIQAHVKICVLALLIERVIEDSTGKTWTEIDDTLTILQVTKYRSEVYEVNQRNEPSKEVKEMLKALKLPVPKKVLEITALQKSEISVDTRQN
jgi:transposase